MFNEIEKLLIYRTNSQEAMTETAWWIMVE
jgi:hypothetical protein